MPAGASPGHWHSLAPWHLCCSSSDDADGHAGAGSRGRCQHPELLSLTQPHTGTHTGQGEPQHHPPVQGPWGPLDPLPGLSLSCPLPTAPAQHSPSLPLLQSLPTVPATSQVGVQPPTCGQPLGVSHPTSPLFPATHAACTQQLCSLPSTPSHSFSLPTCSKTVPCHVMPWCITPHTLSVSRATARSKQLHTPNATCMAAGSCPARAV